MCIHLQDLNSHKILATIEQSFTSHYNQIRMPRGVFRELPMMRLALPESESTRRGVGRSKRGVKRREGLAGQDEASEAAV